MSFSPIPRAKPISYPCCRQPIFQAAEAAAYLHTTVQGIYALVKRGRLRPMPGRSKLLLTREALDACL